MSPTTLKPYTRSRSSDASAWYLGKILFTFLATAEDTNGQFALLEAQGKKGNEPPPHTHRDEDECFYIVSGEVSVFVDGQRFYGRPGSWVFIPRGSVHTFALESDEATMLILFTPAGFEGYFQEMSVPADSIVTPPISAGPPDVQHLLAVGAKYGCEFVAPS
jgi:quercetin dioxygenase-like cupin family protein